MNAETLIGTVLGTCTLQKLIGQGGMGAVFLAQQSRPRRQVAVKVLSPVMALVPAQKAAFLERFRRETDATAALEHPHIMPVHEYGEQNGMAYLVMPYISGGTLGDELEREQQLSLSTVVNYLDQMATALQFAHERGIIHRDIKPANILMTQEKRLLLCDFGLVKIITDGQTPQTRLTRTGAPLGTPEYMAPEQVIGHNVDARADIYSLGVILYHMIAGVTPFRGEMPMQVAVQHLQVPPPSLRQFRTDLPMVADQVVMRALAKRPDDRYAHALDLASAFRIALSSTGIPLDEGMNSLLIANVNPSAHTFTPRGLFDPSWQTTMTANVGNAARIPDSTQKKELVPVAQQPTSIPPRVQHAPGASMLPPVSQDNSDPGTTATAAHNIVAKTSMTLPSFTGLVSPSATHTPPKRPEQIEIVTRNTPVPAVRLGGVRTKLFRPTSNAGITPKLESDAVSVSPDNEQRAASETLHSAQQSTTRQLGDSMADYLIQAQGSTQTLEDSQAGYPLSPVTRQLGDSQAGYSLSPVTRQLEDAQADYPLQGAPTTLRVTQSMKIVQMPVAGQPGRYVTGLLPTLPKTPQPTIVEEPDVLGKGKEFVTKNRKMVAAISIALLVILSSSMFWFIRSHAQQAQITHPIHVTATPNLMATTTAAANATAEANTIFIDSLNQNTHNWPISLNTTGSKEFAFIDGAYHVTAIDSRASAITLLTPDELLPNSFVYTLSMKEVKGNDTSVNNQFGMILRFTSRQKNGRPVTTFYAFEVVNANAGEYQFWKYDDSVSSVTPWTKIWSAPYHGEYHFAHGMNTFRVSMSGSQFKFTVNGKMVGQTRENSLTNGQIGMLVNLRGTEVAFSNLILTY